MIADISYAGGMIARVQQMKAMKQKQHTCPACPRFPIEYFQPVDIDGAVLDVVHVVLLE